MPQTFPSTHDSSLSPLSEDLDANLVVLDAKLRHMRDDISAIESSNNSLELQARNNTKWVGEEPVIGVEGSGLNWYCAIPSSPLVPFSPFSPCIARHVAHQTFGLA